MPDLKKDAQGNFVNEKGNIVDEKGNIIQAKDDKKKVGLSLEEIPEEIVKQLPANFGELSKDDQTKELVKLANKAKSADDKEKFIQERNKELGELRKIKEQFDEFKDNLDGKKPSKSELETFLEGLKSKYDENDLKDIQAIASLMAKEESKPIKGMLKSILMDNLETSILSDPDIDSKIYQEHSEDIEKEYSRFREPKSPKEMRENLKEAALKVQKKIVDKMSEKEKETFEAERKARIGGIPEVGEKGKVRDTKTDDEKIVKGIVDAGKSKKEGIFG